MERVLGTCVGVVNFSMVVGGVDGNRHLVRLFYVS